jgi:competence protein ComFC
MLAGETPAPPRVGDEREEPPELHWLTKGFLDLLFPPRCQVCRRFGPDALCGDCAADVEPITPPFCHHCGAPFDPLARGGPMCASCRQTQRSSYVIGRSMAVYDGALREAVHRLKYDGKRVLARVLGEMLAETMLNGQRSGDARSTGEPSGGAAAVPADAPPPAPPAIPFDKLSLVVPVPLHPVRARERGFNQSELLCAPLAHRANVPIATHCLERVKLNAPQVAVPARMRRANVRGAFGVTDPAAVASRTVLVFDDVWTTGSTMLECARVLRQAGASAVYLLTLCRAVAKPQV